VMLATFISTIVMGFIFIFLSDISSWIVDTKNEVLFMWKLYDFSYKLNNYRNVYNTWWILINNTSSWSDVFILKDIEWNNAIILWTVRLSDKKLYTDNTIYEDRWIWFRRLSTTEQTEIVTNIANIYDYIFQEDQIYTDLKVQDLSFSSYNSWTIYEMNLNLDTSFNSSLIWQYWVDLPKDSLKILNIDF
jgi:hypothetical protein